MSTSSTHTQDPSDSDRPGLKRWEWCLILVAPLILVGVAINHQIVTATSDLNPWKGGGFGMFATIDSNANRDIYIQAVRRDGGLFPGGEQASGKVVTRFVEPDVITNPTDAKLRLVALEGFRADEVPDDPSTDQDDVVAIRVQVRTFSLDSRTRELTSVLIRSLEVPVP